MRRTRDRVVIELVVLYDSVLIVAANDHVRPLLFRTLLLAVRADTLIIVGTVLFASANYQDVKIVQKRYALLMREEIQMFKPARTHSVRPVIL